MFQNWTFSHPTPCSEGRAERYVSNLAVAITIPFESWHLMWTLRSLNISNTGILCAFDVDNEDAALRSDDLNTLLEAEPDVQIQIESTDEDLFSPLLKARLVRKTKRHWGLELAFQFMEENDDLVCLVGSFESQRPQNSQPHH